MLDADAIREWLQMEPNTQEGGFFASTYVSKITLPKGGLPGFKEARSEQPLCSAIYYLLESPGCSVLHRVKSDMLYHFYAGDPVQMLLLPPEGSGPHSEVFVFGNNLAQKQHPMKVIPGGTWLGSRLMPGGSWALMGVSMAPGFDPAQYAIGKRNELLEQYPEQSDLIIQLTRAE